jgi:DNA adenine methylase
MKDITIYTIEIIHMAVHGIQKPILKWVGGKTQIINDIIKFVPENIENYHEPFLGGGSVLFTVLSLKAQDKIVIHKDIFAYDLNESLINVYKQIQNDYKDVYDKMNEYFTCYNAIVGQNDGIVNRTPNDIEEAKKSKQNYYYWIRGLYNKSEVRTVDHAAMFIFLNKTCFRGLYREGPNGFNVPFGNYKNPGQPTKEELRKVAKLIENVKFKCCDFIEAVNDVGDGDFVYLDPPYAPENKNSFVGYTAGGFNLETHEELFTAIHELNETGAHFTMSNAKVSMVMNKFKNFTCVDIKARRAINSKKPESTTTEVIITNIATEE